jgi:hypothetical protein
MTLIKAIKLLNSIGVEYAILAGEEKHGTLEIVTKKQKSRKNRSYADKYGRGALRDYVRQYIQPLKVGEVTYVPKGNFDLNEVSTASASYAHFAFGKGGHTGRQDREKQVFEIMRLET